MTHNTQPPTWFTALFCTLSFILGGMIGTVIMAERYSDRISALEERAEELEDPCRTSPPILCN